MNNLTQLNLSVDGLYRGSLLYPRIENIESIDYDYDTLHHLTKIDLNCYSDNSIKKILNSVIPNVPKDSKEIQVSVNYPKLIASRC